MCFIFGASTFNAPPEGLFQIGNVPPSIDFYRRGIFICMHHDPLYLFFEALVPSKEIVVRNNL